MNTTWCLPAGHIWLRGKPGTVCGHGMVTVEESLWAAGDGAIGQWSDRAMSRWSDGAMERWGDGAMER